VYSLLSFPSLSVCGRRFLSINSVLVMVKQTNERPLTLSRPDDKTELSKDIRIWEEQERQVQLQERRSELEKTLPRRPNILDGRANINDSSDSPTSAKYTGTNLALDAKVRSSFSEGYGGQNNFSGLLANVPAGKRNTQAPTFSADAYSPRQHSQDMKLSPADMEADVSKILHRLEMERDGVQTVCSKFAEILVILVLRVDIEEFNLDV
jgi:hypothetical protein